MKKRFTVYRVLPELAVPESSKRTLNTWMVFQMQLLILALQNLQYMEMLPLNN